MMGCEWIFDVDGIGLMIGPSIFSNLFSISNDTTNHTKKVKSRKKLMAVMVIHLPFHIAAPEKVLKGDRGHGICTLNSWGGLSAITLHSSQFQIDPQ
jgi:hypothetical protein